ncbi:hypothetical protein SO802_015518 [Lithocarpus litseifolius]|uniref:Uncharacterized protein n=1 Tax=Lithocarpus litseifolius TaxID=425828 RepID=A0AAW2CUH3_9ROSI
MSNPNDANSFWTYDSDNAYFNNDDEMQYGDNDFDEEYSDLNEEQFNGSYDFDDPFFNYEAEMHGFCNDPGHGCLNLDHDIIHFGNPLCNLRFLYFRFATLFLSRASSSDARASSSNARASFSLSVASIALFSSLLNVAITIGAVFAPHLQIILDFCWRWSSTFAGEGKKFQILLKMGLRRVAGDGSSLFARDGYLMECAGDGIRTEWEIRKQIK